MTVGVDSWVTIAEADAYLTNRIGGASWFTLEDAEDPGVTSKELLLVSAFRKLRGLTGFNIPVASTDENVKNAQIETGYFLLNYFAETEQREVAQRSGLSSFEFYKRKETFNGNEPSLPSFITDSLVNYSSLGGNFVDLLAGLTR